MADEATTTTTESSAADTTGDTTPQTTADTTTPAQANSDGTDWINEARKWEGRSKSNLAKAEAAEKAKAEAEARLQAVLKAAGLDTADDEKIDPDQLVKDLEVSNREKVEAKIELAIYKAANGIADPGKLTDSRSFMSAVAKLDPGADDFDAKVAAAIKDAVKANPLLAATTRQAGSSGGEVTGKQPPKPLAEQLAEAQKAGNIQLAVAIKQRMAAAGTNQ